MRTFSDQLLRPWTLPLPGGRRPGETHRTVLAHSSDLARAVLAGSKLLDAAYDEVRKPKRPPGKRKVARSKKIATEAAKRGEKVTASTAHSACDPEDHRETSDGTEEIELGKVIARLRRAQAHNTDTMIVCDALERRLKRP
jgi:hypothetical protein